VRVPPPSNNNHTDGVGWLLGEVARHAASLFAEQVATISLTPPQAAILRAIAAEPGRSQQTLSAQLGLLPSRFVAHVDALEQRGCVERRRNPRDRRLQTLYLTEEGKKLVRRLSGVTRDHERQLIAGLNAEQSGALRDLLVALAVQHGLAPRVHPGYHRPDVIIKPVNRGYPADDRTIKPAG
jgi:DNA-binding MarR family transcriptional regulator